MGREKKTGNQPKMGMETQRESAGQLDLLFLLQWNTFSVHLTCPPLAVASLIFRSSAAGRIGSGSITIFLLFFCPNQLPVPRSRYFSFSYLLNVRYNMHQS